MLVNANPSGVDGFRADYAPTQQPPVAGDGLPQALIDAVDAGSPAALVGLTSGCKITYADGAVMEDIVDWFWLSDGFEVELEFEDPEGQWHEAVLQREPMQDWGLHFADNVFDGVRTCCNACTFCFMSMLPQGMRAGMYLRDDDYRLSFLQGNFVTLTNMSDHDVQRVIDMNMSPLHVSLHALDANARLALMGCNHQRGLDVLMQLLQAGIDVHLQAVLVPGVNDGPVLDELMSFAVKQQHVLSLGIVPLGFTRFQDRFDRAYDEPSDALRILQQAEPYRARSRELWGTTKVQPADEFYVNAFGDEVEQHLPHDWEYDDYPQYFDGIGMLRNLVDEWHDEICAQGTRLGLGRPVDADEVAPSVVLVAGRALDGLLRRLFDQLDPELSRHMHVLGVDNQYFGGNVDVTGLLTGEDVVKACKVWMHGHDRTRETFFVLPQPMFNDDGLTLDNCSTAAIQRAVGSTFSVVCYNAKDILGEVRHLLRPWFLNV